MSQNITMLPILIEINILHIPFNDNNCNEYGKFIAKILWFFKIKIIQYNYLKIVIFQFSIIKKKKILVPIFVAESCVKWKWTLET